MVSPIKREVFWIKELWTLTPYGLNDRLDHKNWRYRSRDDIAGLCFNSLQPLAPNIRSCKGSGINRIKIFSANNVINDLESYYNDLENWRFLTRKKVFFFPTNIFESFLSVLLIFNLINHAKYLMRFSNLLGIW